MLHALETSGRRTRVSLAGMALSPCQQETIRSRSVLSSYVVGPLDPAHLLTIPFRLSSGRGYTLLMPVPLPRSILRDPAFRDGHQWNVESEEECDKQEAEEPWTRSVPRLLNHLYSSLTDARLYRNVETGEEFSDWRAWEAGWLLRDLTRLAERDCALSLVGLAHLRVLLHALTLTPSLDDPFLGPFRVHALHERAIKAYRMRVQTAREQGCSYEQAQRLAWEGVEQATGKGARTHGRTATR